MSSVSEIENAIDIRKLTPFAKNLTQLAQGFRLMFNFLHESFDVGSPRRMGAVVLCMILSTFLGLVACKPKPTPSTQSATDISAVNPRQYTNTGTLSLTSADFKTRHDLVYTKETPAEYRSNFLQRCELDPFYPWQHPLLFAGRVIDNRGVPVRDAEVTFSWETPPPARKMLRKEVYSDSLGYVEFHDAKAAWLQIHVERDGYSPGPMVRNLHLNYSDPYEPPRMQRYVPDREKPLELLLGKRPTNLVQNSWFAAVPIVANGKEFGWDVDRNVFSRTGQLGLKVDETPVDGSTNIKGIACIHLSIRRGAFRITEELFPFMAPTEGYQPHLRICLEDQETASWPRHYYFYYEHTEGFKKYGVMQVRWGEIEEYLKSPERRFIVNVSTYINETGGRDFGFSPDDLPNSRNVNTTLAQMLQWASRP